MFLKKKGKESNIEGVRATKNRKLLQLTNTKFTIIIQTKKRVSSFINSIIHSQTKIKANANKNSLKKGTQTIKKQEKSNPEIFFQNKHTYRVLAC